MGGLNMEYQAAIVVDTCTKSLRMDQAKQKTEIVSISNRGKKDGPESEASAGLKRALHGKPFGPL